jgi:hypothetical protein
LGRIFHDSVTAYPRANVDRVESGGEMHRTGTRTGCPRDPSQLSTKDFDWTSQICVVQEQIFGDKSAPSKTDSRLPILGLEIADILNKHWHEPITFDKITSPSQLLVLVMVAHGLMGKTVLVTGYISEELKFGDSQVTVYIRYNDMEWKATPELCAQ